jgi:hypothetical protein
MLEVIISLCRHETMIVNIAYTIKTYLPDPSKAFGFSMLVLRRCISCSSVKHSRTDSPRQKAQSGKQRFLLYRTSYSL